MTAVELAQCIGGVLMVPGMIAIGAGAKRTGNGLALAALLVVCIAFVVDDAPAWRIALTGALIAYFGIAFGHALTQHRSNGGAR